MGKKAGAAGLAGAALVAFSAYVGELQYREGVAYKSYLDGVNVWTNCMGNTHDVKPNATYTKEECRKIDEANARFAWDYVDTVVEVDITWGQYKAYADYVFNAGPGNFKKSSMLFWANRKERQKSCDAFREHMFAGRPPNRVDCRIRANKCFGIVSRREQERTTCLED
jgi:lysozyme